MNDAISPGRKNRQNSRLLSPSARFSKYHTVKLSKFNRSVRVLETSHLASSTSRCLDCPVTECQSRACLVVETHRQCKRQSRTPSYAGYDHHNRRLQERLGCSASILSDQKESLQHINYLELKASFLALKTFLKGKSQEPHLCN